MIWARGGFDNNTVARMRGCGEKRVKIRPASEKTNGIHVVLNAHLLGGQAGRARPRGCACKRDEKRALPWSSKTEH